ncbi:DNA-directed DNA polymerase alpha catalytic subunit pol1 [Dimargaris verticillata]|uniref:DNA polymerase n=1 Tax=Dimargaris verticillata TaxID=2761393 RepID=A0A9W8B2Y8_9FUNG|nr:DNA-directed DNA polymerase alpha catalytic subunit pol1 [Dimargaris verticillata]
MVDNHDSSTSGRSTRRAKSSRLVNRRQQLAALRHIKATGESPLLLHEGQEDDEAVEGDSIFVDADECDAIVKGRLQDDFVVDDEGLGYAETGLDDWDQQPNYDSEEDDENESGASRATNKRTRGTKRGHAAKAGGSSHGSPVPDSQRLSAFFKRGRQDGAGKSKHLLRDGVLHASKADEQFMEGLLNELDEGVDDLPPKRARMDQPPPSRVSRQLKPTSSTVGIPATPARAPTPAVVETIPIAPVHQTPVQPPTVLPRGAHTQPDPITYMDDGDDPELLTEMLAATSAITPAFHHHPAASVTQPLGQSAPTPLARKTSTNKPSSSAAVDREFRPPQFELNLEASAETTAGSQGPFSAISLASQSSGPGPQVLEADGSLLMFWVDAFEKDGVVYLFGKVRPQGAEEYVSCCLSVKGIDRNLFVLPREKLLGDDGQPTDQDVTMLDVYNELKACFQRQGIKLWRSKEVTRKYAFELSGIPTESAYLKVLYPFQQPAYSGSISGKSFQHVFGVNTSPLELLLIKRRIMGPCWLRIDKVQVVSQHLSWCRVEVQVDNLKYVTPLADTDPAKPAYSPGLTVMTISLKTNLGAKKMTKEIIAANLLVNRQVKPDNPVDIKTLPSQQFTVVRALPGEYLPPGLAGQCQKQRFAVETVKGEHALLSYILAILQRADPDIIVGHNFLGHDLNLLLSRMKHNRVDHWSRLGRLRRTQWPWSQNANQSYTSSFAERMIMSGRVVCDTYLAAKDLIRSKSYSLTQLALSELRVDRLDIDFAKIPAYYSNAQDLATFLRHCQFDAFLVASLMYQLQVLPLTKQLTNLAGNLWTRTMTGARAERNEYLLLHEFHRCKYICPDRAPFGAQTRPAKGKGGKATSGAPRTTSLAEADDVDAAEQDLIAEGLAGPDATQAPAGGKSGRRKPAYAGGLVLEPKKGFYDRFVVLLDFNSLYPSIIQEFNICFTTVARSHPTTTEASAKDSPEAQDELPELPDPYLQAGVLPRMLKTLVERRRQVKALMKGKNLTTAQLTQYDIRQRALKLTANSMYGCLGFTHSRFYAKPLAMLITHKGREILQSTVQLAEAEGLEVIYGDTDSIMIHTNTCDLQQVYQLGREFKKKVNERYRLLELDIDGVFQRMLLLKKKKYAALVVKDEGTGSSQGTPLKTEVETKGLDLVRRDWCELSHDVSNYVLAQILSGDDRDEVISRTHGYLAEIGEAIRTQTIAIDKFVINKGLTKNPEDYNDAKSQPHVQVALRMRRQGQSVAAGDTVPYVIASLDSHLGFTGANTDTASLSDSKPSNVSYAERAYHPKEFADPAKGFVVDYEWYLNQQVHPPVARLCEPIEGTDAARLAHFLGLDPSKFRSFTSGAADGRGNGLGAGSGYRTLESQVSDEERFAQVDKWDVRCRACQQSFVFPGIARLPTTEAQPSVPNEPQSDIVVPGFQCPNAECNATVSLASLQVQLTLAIRSRIEQYHQHYLLCDDTMDASQHRTRKMSVYGRRCIAAHCRGRMMDEYSDRALYTQLQYYESLFVLEKAERQGKNESQKAVIRSMYNRHFDVYDGLKSIATSYLDLSARRFINLSEVFSDVLKIKM